MSEIKSVIEAVQAESEATRDESYSQATPLADRPNRVGSVVQSVRLPADVFAQIEDLAKASNVPVSALIRGWVLQGIAAEGDGTVRDIVEQIAADVDRLRRATVRGAA